MAIDLKAAFEELKALNPGKFVRVQIGLDNYNTANGDTVDFTAFVHPDTASCERFAGSSLKEVLDKVRAAAVPATPVADAESVEIK